ncbi:MAG TPA: hypothetical protein PK812_11360 [Beijerinckiaceae bacterium]|nr:hypothetical protein [Beijerinckiaceae bacterium]
MLAMLIQPVSAQSLPEGMTACSISGYSLDRSRAGTPVRAEPNAKAKIVGRIAPPQKATARDLEDISVPTDEVWRAGFQILGIKDGWVLIEKALHPYNDPYYFGTLGRRSTGGIKTYSGRGWLPLSQIGGKVTYYRKMPLGALYAEPREDAPLLPAKNAMEGPLSGGNQPKRILACSGEWVQVESPDGVIGWWRGLCGAPVSDCEPLSG